MGWLSSCWHGGKFPEASAAGDYCGNSRLAWTRAGLTPNAVCVPPCRWYIRRLWHRQPVRLVYQPTARNLRLLSRCPALKRGYHPTPWLTNGHTMTVWGTSKRSKPRPAVVYDRRMLEVDDGGEVALDWVQRPKAELSTWRARAGPSAAPAVLIVLHGLTGGSHEAYVHWMVDAAARAGMRVVVMNARGCGDTQLQTPKTFSAAQTDDLRLTVKHVRELVGDDVDMFLVGFSLGAGILCKYLGEEGYRSDIAAAASLCGSYDMHKTSARMEQTPIHRHVYNRTLAGNLRRWADKQKHMFDGLPWLDMKAIRSATTVRQFDEQTIVKMFGYESVEEYYEDASSGRLMPDVRTPLLILNAEDDPIACASGLEEVRDEAKHNPELIVGSTEEGGHVAWCTGMWGDGASWVEEPVVQWFSSVSRELGESGSAGKRTPSPSRRMRPVIAHR